MDDIKIAVSRFEQYLVNTSDHVWYGILKREMLHKKYTLAEWRAVLSELKTRPAK